MFQIRRVHDDVIPRNKETIIQVQEILRTQFSALPEREIAKLPEQLRVGQPIMDGLFDACHRDEFYASRFWADSEKGVCILVHCTRMRKAYKKLASQGCKTQHHRQPIYQGRDFHDTNRRVRASECHRDEGFLGYF
jgi:hypothetical protein